MEEKLARGQYFCMLYQRTDMADQQRLLYSKNPDMISKNCEHPERAIQLFSYLMSDYGQMLTYLGVEGVTYDIVEGKPMVLPALLLAPTEEFDLIFADFLAKRNELEYDMVLVESNRQMRDLKERLNFE